MGPPLHRLHVGQREFEEKVQPILTEIQVRATATDFPLQKSLPIPAPDHLPLEIVNSILAEVGYPSYVFKRRSEKKTYNAGQRWAGRKASSPPVMALYMTTDPLPRKLGFASRLTIQMRSAERNRTAWLPCHAEQDKTHNWFEVSILRRTPCTPKAKRWEDLKFERPDVIPGEPPERLMPRAFTRLADAMEVLEELGWEMVEYEGRCTWTVPRDRMYQAY